MEIEEYFGNFSYKIWQNKADFCIEKIRKLKKLNKKSDYINELYVTYLQLIENFITLLLVRASLNISYIFEDTRTIMTDFSNNQEKIIEGLLNTILVALPKDQYNEIRERYKILIKEIFKDFNEDKELLNSYKHGFRLRKNTYNPTIGIKITGSNSPFLEIGKYQYGITYITARNEKGFSGKIIYNCSIFFDSEYIYGKITALTKIVEILIFLYGKTGDIKIEYPTLENVGILERKDNARFRNPVGTFNSRTKAKKV